MRERCMKSRLWLALPAFSSSQREPINGGSAGSARPTAG
jgi:hypothetical protein